MEALSGLLLGLFVAILSSTIVSNALPTIIADLHAGQTTYTWVITSSLLATTITTPIWGKLEPAVPEVSDYGQGLARMSRSFLAQMEGGTLPDVVAEAIYRAATQDGPLRVPVGDDADVLAVARARATPVAR